MQEYQEAHDVYTRLTTDGKAYQKRPRTESHLDQVSHSRNPNSIDVGIKRKHSGIPCVHLASVKTVFCSRMSWRCIHDSSVILYERQRYLHSSTQLSKLQGILPGIALPNTRYPATTAHQLSQGKSRTPNTRQSDFTS